MVELNDSYSGRVKSYSDLNKPKSYGDNPLSQSLKSSQFGGSNPYIRPTSIKRDSPMSRILDSRSSAALSEGRYNKPVQNESRRNQQVRDAPLVGGPMQGPPNPGANSESNFFSQLADGSSPVFGAIEGVLNGLQQQQQMGGGQSVPTPSFTPFNYDSFNYSGPSVDDILAGLLDQYGGVFDEQQSGLENRKAQALAAIEQSYKGLQGDLEGSQGAVDKRYEQQQAEMDENAAQAQGAISEGNEDTQARQAALAQMLGTEDAINNSAANEDEQYYAARQAEADAAAQNMVSGSQTRDFNANQNAITTAGFASPEMQFQSRQNYDSALGELDTARNQFQQAAYQNALNQYNQDRNFSLGQYNTERDSAFQNWSAQNQFEQNAANQMYQQQQSAADRAWQEQQADLDRQFQAGQTQAELQAQANQPPDLSDMTNEEQLLQRLQDAGVTPSGSTRWYNDLLTQVSELPAGQELTPQDITNRRSGSSQAESYLVDYARKMGWL